MYEQASNSVATVAQSWEGSLGASIKHVWDLAPLRAKEFGVSSMSHPLLAEDFGKPSTPSQPLACMGWSKAQAETHRCLQEDTVKMYWNTLSECDGFWLGYSNGYEKMDSFCWGKIPTRFQKWSNIHHSSWCHKVEAIFKEEKQNVTC